MKKIIFPLIVMMLILAVVVPACTGSTAENEAAFNQSLQELSTAKANLDSINANTSVDQVKQYQEDLQTAWNNVKSARGDLAISKYNDLEAAWNELESSLSSISGDTTVAQALPSIQAAKATFDATLNEIMTDLTFTPAGTSTP